MPAADIKEISVTWHDERRGPFEYSPPMKKAEVHLYASVPEGGDGVAALNYLHTLVKAKVNEMLTVKAGDFNPVEAAPAGEPQSPATSSGSPASTNEATTPPEQQRRKRRTAAEIAADEAAAAQAKADAAAASGAPAASEPQTPATTPPSSADTTQTTAPTDGEAKDEWEIGGDEATEITNQELQKHCSTTATRVKSPDKVKEVMKLYKPADLGDKPWSINELPQNLRAGFIAKLDELQP